MYTSLSQEANPARIIQIVSGSRSGSTLFKAVLSKSPDVISLAGEEEPYFAMSGNGFGLTSEHDGFTMMRNASLFRRFIEKELTTTNAWVWRFCMQYKGTELARVLDAWCRQMDMPNSEFLRLYQDYPGWLKKMGVWGHYDGCTSQDRIPFKELAFEMPPFVVPKTLQTPSAGKTLLLKSPYNVYRPGIIESIFPNAEVQCIILTRNPAATINGLIDGWKANYGFHKHQTKYGWWKFDAPPGWEHYIHSTIAEKAHYQWYSSSTRLLEYSGVWVKFEEFLDDPLREVRNVCRHLDIRPPDVVELPHIMSTVPPERYRWQKRQDEIMPLLAIPQTKNLISEMLYADQTNWY